MTDTEKKLRIYWHNWMGMHRDLEEAKCWTPESELEDLRQYVELSTYDSLAKQLEELKAELHEQCRLNGIGSEREARLEAELKEMTAKFERNSIAAGTYSIEVEELKTELAIMKSRAAQFESTVLATVAERDGARAALEDRDQMHTEHVARIEAENKKMREGLLKLAQLHSHEPALQMAFNVARQALEELADSRTQFGWPLSGEIAREALARLRGEEKE